MSQIPRLSPDASRAHEIDWRPWGADAFAAAVDRDRPVLLHLAAAWCHWCHVMDETTYSDPEVLAVIARGFVPVRVDVDRHPHVRDRYLAGGWPTVAFLAPTGEVLWAGTAMESDEFLRVAGGVLDGWSRRRESLREEIEKQRRARAAAGRRRAVSGIVRRETADDILTVIQDSADPRDGGLGPPPRFPAPDAVELLFVAGIASTNPDWTTLAERHLDGILAGELFDRVEGGFFRYALEEDWLDPQQEKLLTVNAGLVRAYALGAALAGREDWREAATRTVEWVDTTLRRPDGLWAASQEADPEYYGRDQAGRRELGEPWTEPAILTDANAVWIMALADAGGRLGRADWIERAEQGLSTLLDAARSDDALRHVADDESAPDVVGLLVDDVTVARAALALAQATGRKSWLETATELVDHMAEKLLQDDGTFRDLPADPDAIGALHWPDTPLDLNGDAARLLLDLALFTGERSYRAMAERLLAALAPGAARYGARAASFGLAVHTFFEAPLTVVLVGDHATADPLRRAALAAPAPDRRVWTLAAGGKVAGRTFPDRPAPAAYVCGARACSPALSDPARLDSAIRDSR